MSIDTDDEILQDFLVEAGEILELLSEQLVELEQNPQDKELLNAVFRGFHTVKGGGSFLGLDTLVEVCHQAEDVFNVLRNGERVVDAALMDIILRVTDVVMEMFAMIQNGEEPPPADRELLASLAAYARPVETASVETVVATPSADDGDITDDEFEAMLDAVAAGGPAIPTTANKEVTTSANDDISDDEFEDLLNQLHGEGGTPIKVTPEPAVPVVANTNSDDISDDEFEAMLDQVHGVSGAPKGEDSKPKEEIKEKPAVVEKTDVSPSVQEKAKAKAKPEATVRVDTSRLDDIMNLVGELVLVRNRLSTLKGEMNEDVVKAVSSLDVVTADLQSSVMKTRMQPIKKVFGRFPRVVRDLARTLNKDIELELRGEDTDLDKNLVEALADPLVHLVRNAVDHGIEMPDDREAMGKSRTGKVILAAAQEGDHILLSIEDDGKGLNANGLRQSVVSKGLMDADIADRLSEKECFELIFMPGFSTKEEISDVSGRGVGMDVVKTRINQLNGVIEITSAKNKGTKISIRVPLTLAIMPTLMVLLGKQPFALPLASVNEIFNLDTSKTNVVDGQLVVIVREKALPLFYLSEWLVSASDASADDDDNGSHVVIVNVGGRRVGFVVDQLIGQEEVVIKPLGALLRGMPGFAGATITGDGRIALILDVPSLVKANT